MAARRVTAHDIAQVGDISAFIGITIDQIRAGNMETKEIGASVLRSLTEQASGGPSGSKGKGGGDEKTDFDPREEKLDFTRDNITLIAQAYGIKPLVSLLISGSSLAQMHALAPAHICII